MARFTIRVASERFLLSLCTSYSLLLGGGFNVNKNDLVAVVADKTGLSKADATKSVDCVFDAITDSLKTGDEVRLVGFGTFTVSKRDSSEGRNPRPGERKQIPAYTQPTFKAAKNPKDSRQQ